MKIITQQLEFPRDAEDLIQWLSSEEWPYHVNLHLSRDKVSAMIQEGFFDGSNHQTYWILFEGERAGMIRVFDLDDVEDGNPLFDLRLLQKFRRRGLGQNAVTWLTDHLFIAYPQLDRIEGCTRADNLAMRTVFEKCFFAKEAHKRKAWPNADGLLLDSVHYAILREDWESKTITPVKWDN